MSKSKTKKVVKAAKKNEEKTSKASKPELKKQRTKESAPAEAVGSVFPGLPKDLKTEPAAQVRKERQLSRPTEGEVKVITLNRIVIGEKWTQPLGLKQGDSLKIRREDSSLILTK